MIALKKKQIAFIEMETHSALLEQWYLLLKDMTFVEYHFFVSKKVNDKLTSIPQHKISEIPFVDGIDFSGFDAVVVNTMHRNFEQYQRLLQDKPVLCLIHNLNFSLFFKTISWKNILKEKQRFTYFLKLYIKEKVASHRKLILGAKQLGVLSHSLLEEIKGKSSLAGKTEVIQLNYCHHFSFNTSDTIQIVIPGNVSNKRKDINLLFELLPQLQPQEKIHFTFLGKPENHKISKQLEFLKETCHQNINLSYFDRFIPWEEYSGRIAEAHLLLCPVKKETSFYWVDEVYGKTKVSGSEGDCIYNGKIGLFPTTYPKMDWHNWYYENGDSLRTILNTLTFEHLESEYRKLEPFVEKYAFEKVKKRVETQLIKLTEI